MPSSDRRITRRRALASIGTTAASVSVLATPASAAYAITEYETGLHSLRQEYDIRGVSTAIVTPNDSSPASPVYRDATGFDRSYWEGDVLRHDQLTPSHRLRLASVTKTLTSAAILRMIDLGYVEETDRVFGEDGILPPEGWGRPDSACPLRITNFLNHDYGIAEERDADWTRVVYRTPEDLTLREMVRHIHEEFSVGTSGHSDGGHEVCDRPDEYYNYGYGVLAAVVDTLYRGEDGYDAGRGYETFVRDELLDPAGAGGVERVDTNYGAVENEGYHHSSDGNPYAEWLTRERAWGWAGWAGTPLEIARFGQSVVAGEPFNTSVIDDYTDLADYGWTSYRNGYYVGHDGSQVGVLAALRCHPERTYCVLINTRHGDSWDDDPTEEIVARTRDLAMELV